MPELIKGFGADARIGGQAIMKWQQFQRWGQHNVEYGTPTRKAVTIAKPLAAIGLTIAGIFGAVALGKKLLRAPENDRDRSDERLSE